MRRRVANAGCDLEEGLISAGTHWYQMRFLLENPLTVIAGQRIEGHFSLKSNNIQSYFARLRMRLQGTEAWSESLCMDLKDPEYRALTSANAYVPPPAGFIRVRQRW